MTDEEKTNLEEFKRLQDDFTRCAFAMRRFSTEIVEHLALREYHAIPVKLEILARHYNMSTEAFNNFAKHIKSMEKNKQTPGTVS